jgi:hypothetical protein
MMLALGVDWKRKQPGRKEMLIDQTPAVYVTREVARMTEHDPTVDSQMALHMITTSCAQVIADDVAAGERPWPPTVARYVEARDRYRAAVVERNQREIDVAAGYDRLADSAGGNG